MDAKPSEPAIVEAGESGIIGILIHVKVPPFTEP